MSQIIGYTFRGKEISASMLASDQQGATSNRYYNIDRFSDGVLEEGERIVTLTYDGAPKLSGYFLPYEQYQEIIAKHGPDSKVLGEMCQVSPHYDEDERIAQGKTKVEIYEVKKSPIIAAYGPTLANDQFGPGGVTQEYIPLAQTLKEEEYLVKVGEDRLINYERDPAETKRMLAAAEKAHSNLYGDEIAKSKYLEKDISFQAIDRSIDLLSIRIDPITENGVKKHQQEVAAAIDSSLERITKKEFQARIQEIQQAPDVKELQNKTPAKTIYNAYAKDVVDRTGEWKKETTDREIVLRMLQDNRPPENITDAMRHSPAMEGLTGTQLTVKTHKFVGGICRTPEAQNLVKSKGLER